MGRWTLAACMPPPASTAVSDGHAAAAFAANRLLDTLAIVMIAVGVSAAWMPDQPRWRLFPLCRRHAAAECCSRDTDRHTLPVFCDPQ
jgi:hypothetical protein